MSKDPYELANLSAQKLAEITKIARHDVLVVLGSGWTPAIEALGKADAELAVTDLPGFSAPAVAGHAGKLRSVKVGNYQTLIQMGRTHYYEGRGTAAVVHAVRTAIASGVKTVILTNACGGLQLKWKPGTPVLIRDHINLTGATPLVGPKFLDVSEIYSKRLRKIAKEIDPTLDEGVYVQFHGPQYETPAEVQMALKIGGDLVGMSTAIEAIAAREAQAEVLGISMVTNPGAGLTSEHLNHEEVLAAGLAAAARMGDLLKKVIEKL
ncbi:MAG: purine-nucleoside phosphorylase [Actinomycetota bacterium]|nr:purine-nucleoside phosphorylase [Actinomycetota bacterium]MDA3025951.1 purine-nucleoside phosphorylase [Actinomycetota bacterium]